MQSPDVAYNLKYKPMRHEHSCKIVLDNISEFRSNTQIPHYTYVCGPVNLGHFIIPFELMITLIAQLCFHTGFGKAHSNTLGLNVYVVTQGDEMTQAIHLLSVSLVFIICQPLNI